MVPFRELSVRKMKRMAQRARLIDDWLSSSSSKRDINVVLAAHDKKLLAIPDVVGVYVGTLQDRRTLCLKVMLARKTEESARKIPRSMEGYPVVIEISGEIRALGKP